MWGTGKKGTPARAMVRKDDKTQFQLMTEENTTSVVLGASRAKAFVILGRDSNDTGTADAVLIDGERKAWAWKFAFDPFSQNGTNYKRSLFGDRSGIPFLFKGRGRYDSLAVLHSRMNRSGTIQYRGLNNKKLIRTIRLKNVAVGNAAPLLLRNKEGQDHFVFVESSKQATVALTVDLHGKVITRTHYPPEVTVVTGYFTTSNYEELGYIGSQTLIFGYKSSEQVPLRGKLITTAPKEYQGEEVSPTPLPEVIVVNSPPPLATEISPQTPTYTTYPMYSPLPTFTSTLAYTPFPTYSNTTTPTVTNTPDIVPPTGFTLTLGQNQVNLANQSSFSFTILNGEVGAIYNYSLDDNDANSAPIYGSGTIVGTSQLVVLDASSLSDGQLSLAIVLRDAAGNASLPRAASVQKDGTAPAITNVSIANGTFGVGSYIPITLQISENVSVSGVPQLTLNVGGSSRNVS